FVRLFQTRSIPVLFHRHTETAASSSRIRSVLHRCPAYRALSAHADAASPNALRPVHGHSALLRHVRCKSHRSAFSINGPTMHYIEAAISDGHQQDQAEARSADS